MEILVLLKKYCEEEDPWYSHNSQHIYNRFLDDIIVELQASLVTNCKMLKDLLVELTEVKQELSKLSCHLKRVCFSSEARVVLDMLEKLKREDFRSDPKGACGYTCESTFPETFPSAPKSIGTTSPSSVTSVRPNLFLSSEIRSVNSATHRREVGHPLSSVEQLCPNHNPMLHTRRTQFLKTQDSKGIPRDQHQNLGHYSQYYYYLL
ncbi:hypothetical protein G4B88_007436, partial [Cannabis sativa]